MKKNCLLVILAFILIGNVCAQDKLSETERLASFCKIYGFLKYYHPNVSKGSFDWDKEFFKTLPLVLEASDKDAISSVYLDWIHDLGEIEQVQVKESTKTYFDKILI